MFSFTKHLNRRQDDVENLREYFCLLEARASRYRPTGEASLEMHELEAMAASLSKLTAYVDEARSHLSQSKLAV